jgi:hypothetical protein
MTRADGLDGGWERIAQRPGGTVTCLAAAPDLATVFASTPAGLARSDDGGGSWRMLPTSDLSLLDALAVSSGFEAGGGVFAGGVSGLRLSADRGVTWRPLLTSPAVTAVAVSSPGDEGDARVMAGTEQDGVLLSTDGGTSWQRSSAGLLDLRVTAIALSPGFAVDRTAFAGTASGVYMTRNGGRSWRILPGLGARCDVQCLALLGDVLAVGTRGRGVLITNDRGASWREALGLEGESVTAIAVSPTGRLAAATDRGMMLSNDGGGVWEAVPGRATAILSLAFVAGGRLLAGTVSDGAFLSGDGGASWSAANEGLLGRLPGGLAVEPGTDQLFWYGPESGVAGSTDGGRTWRTLGLEGEWLTTLALPGRGVLCAGGEGGLFVGGDGGWRLVLGAPVAAVAAGADARLLAVLAGGELLASDDGGARWRSLHVFPEGGRVTALLASAARFCAVVSVPEEGAYRHHVWWSRSSMIGWREVMDRRAAGPMALAPIESGILAASGAELIRVSDEGAVTAVSRVSTDAGFVIHGLASAGGRSGRVALATRAGVLFSEDEGAALSPLPGGPEAAVATALTADGTIFALGSRAELWRHGPASHAGGRRGAGPREAPTGSRPEQAL